MRYLNTENAVTPLCSVSDFLAVVNQSLEIAFPSIDIEGEVASFKVNQHKWVFFDLKDDSCSVSCFMPVHHLRTPIEDGMKVIVSAAPKVTNWGKFSITVQQYRPSGEGSLRRSFHLLKLKLEQEGLFRPERKRLLPNLPSHIGVISSTQAAGYSDFLKIIGERWGDLTIEVAHVQVQGQGAADQIIRAIAYFNAQPQPPELLALIRGGGSSDDLATFNDELLVRAIVASRIPTVVGVGHEVDETLADLVADVRASTPSNAAQLIVPDKHEVLRRLKDQIANAHSAIHREIAEVRMQVEAAPKEAFEAWREQLNAALLQLQVRQTSMVAYDPEAVLRRGYAIVRGGDRVGDRLEIITRCARMKARIETYEKRNDH